MLKCWKNYDANEKMLNPIKNASFGLLLEKLQRQEADT